MKIPPKDLLTAAKSVLKNAYAPYSRFSVAASLRAEDGSIYAGCNVENAAYSLVNCAETSAISALISGGEKKIIEALILVDHPKICPPCGACRQRLLEFSPPNLPVHLCTLSGKYQQTTLTELLPFAFGPNNLE